MQIAHEAQQPQSTHTAVRRQKRTETASSRTSAQAADVDSSNGARQCTGALGRPGSSPLTLVSARSDPRPQIHDRVLRPRRTRAQSRLCPRRPAAGSDVPRWVRRPAAGGGGAYRLCYGFNSDVARTVKPGARRPCLTRNRTESTAAIELPMTASGPPGSIAARLK